MFEKLKKQWFLVALSSVVATGFLFGPQLEFLTNLSTFRQIVVMVVMFLMALPLPLSSFIETAKRPLAPFLASLINLLVGPLLTILFLAFLSGELSGGLVIALATPCTLASATVWTRRAGGNDTIAIMVTVITNMFCVFVTPAWVFLLVSEKVEGIPFWNQVAKLTYLVVIPIFAAQVVRSWKPIGSWAKSNKIVLSSFAQSGLLYIVLVGTIGSSIRLADQNGSSLWQWLVYYLLSPLFIYSCLL